MLQKKTYFKIIGGVMLVGVLSFGGLALAGGDSKLKFSSGFGMFKKHGGFMNKGFMQKGMGMMGKDNQVLQTALDKLVEKGTITQDKAKEVQTFLDKQVKARKAEFEKFRNLTPEERRALLAKRVADKNNEKVGQRSSICNLLVDEKILTQDQATALETQIKDLNHEERKQRLTTEINSLVDNKTITKEQADKIIAKFEEMVKEREALMEKTKDMTREERHDYIQKNIKVLKDPLSQLVEEKVITAEQAQAIGEVFPHGKGPMGGKFSRQKGLQRGMAPNFKYNL